MKTPQRRRLIFNRMVAFLPIFVWTMAVIEDGRRSVVPFSDLEVAVGWLIAVGIAWLLHLYLTRRKREHQ